MLYIINESLTCNPRYKYLPSSYTNVYAVFADVDQSDDDDEGSGHHHAMEVVDHLAQIDTVHPRPASPTPAPRILQARQIHRLLGSPMVETMKATILSPSNTGLKVTIEDACAASAQGVDSSDIRDASNMKHKGTARKSQKEPPPHPGCHLSGDILPHPGQSSATMIIADYFGVTLTSYMPDHTLKSQIEATHTLASEHIYLSEHIAMLYGSYCMRTYTLHLSHSDFLPRSTRL